MNKHRTRPDRMRKLYMKVGRVYSYPVKVVIDTMEKTIKRIGHMSSSVMISSHVCSDEFDSDDAIYSIHTDEDDNSLNYLYILLVLIMLIMMILLIKYDKDEV
jgi:hypothetical protein